MQQRKLSEKLSGEEVILVPTHPEKIKRYFPMSWGLASFALFVVFVVITLFQFKEASDDNIYALQLQAYESDTRAYDAAVKANADCIDALPIRETYRTILTGSAEVQQEQANFPAELFPDSPEAKAYQERIGTMILEKIITPLVNDLPPKTEAECPIKPDPNDKPVRPTR